MLVQSPRQVNHQRSSNDTCTKIITSWQRTRNQILRAIMGCSFISDRDVSSCICSCKRKLSYVQLSFTRVALATPSKSPTSSGERPNVLHKIQAKGSVTSQASSFLWVVLAVWHRDGVQFARPVCFKVQVSPYTCRENQSDKLNCLPFGISCTCLHANNRDYRRIAVGSMVKETKGAQLSSTRFQQKYLKNTRGLF